MNRSKVILSENAIDRRSMLISAVETGLDALESYEDIPSGMFGSKAVIKTGNVELNSAGIDFDFTVPFDDDLEANQADITIYNLSDNTINNITKDAEITIEAGYKDDTGVIFKGIIDSVKTGYDDVDKVTQLTCFNCKGTETVENISYAENTKASAILNDLIKKLNMPIAVFKTRRDYTYTDSVTVEGNLRENIKNYADVCGISVYANNGSIYARYIKDGDNINFTVSEDTGLIGSPEHYIDEINAEDYVDEIDGYECEMLLQHRITTGVVINLTSKSANGSFRVRSGEHNYTSDGEATTTFKAIGEIKSYVDEEKAEKTNAKTAKSNGEKVIAAGKKYKGTPYDYGGDSPTSGMDCSHFVVRAFKDSGVQSKITSYQNAAGLYALSTKISAANRQKGDIIFFNNGSTNHIGIYTGGEKMLHCYYGGGVQETPISYGGTLVGYGRLY